MPHSPSHAFLCLIYPHVPHCASLPYFFSFYLIYSLKVFGDLDEELYKGDMLYTPVVKKWYYEVIITDIAVNGVSLGVNCKKYNYDKTIVDSGTTNLRVSTEVFNAILVELKKYDKVQKDLSSLLGF